MKIGPKGGHVQPVFPPFQTPWTAPSSSSSLLGFHQLEGDLPAPPPEPRYQAKRPLDQVKQRDRAPPQPPPRKQRAERRQEKPEPHVLHPKPGSARPLEIGAIQNVLGLPGGAK